MANKRNWIREHREEIDNAIRQACPNAQYFNDEERELWVCNVEGLYTWARSEGVNV